MFGFSIEASAAIPFLTFLGAILGAALGATLGAFGGFRVARFNQQAERERWYLNDLLGYKVKVFLTLSEAMTNCHDGLRELEINVPATRREFEQGAAALLRAFEQAYNAAWLYFTEEQKEKFSAVLSHFRIATTGIWHLSPARREEEHDARTFESRVAQVDILKRYEAVAEARQALRQVLNPKALQELEKKL